MAPDIDTVGYAFTVTFIVAVFWQPKALVTVYDINAVPTVSPVTAPEKGSTSAIVGEALLHVPPAVALLSVVDPPLSQTVAVPVMAFTVGSTRTVIFNVVEEVHPAFVSAYTIAAGPAEFPVTSPDVELTDALPGFVLLHVPPLAAFVNV